MVRWVLTLESPKRANGNMNGFLHNSRFLGGQVWSMNTQNLVKSNNTSQSRKVCTYIEKLCKGQT